MIELPDSRVCFGLASSSAPRWVALSALQPDVSVHRHVPADQRHLEDLRLDTHLKSLNSRNSTRMSSKERWLITSNRRSSLAECSPRPVMVTGHSGLSQGVQRRPETREAMQ